MGEELYSQALMLVCGELAPMAGDLDVEGGRTEKLHLWELQKTQTEPVINGVPMAELILEVTAE